MFLTAAQLIELTGLKRYSAQARWLSIRGYKFERRVDGSIAMLLEELQAHLVGKAAPRKRWRQDLSALDKAG